MQKTMHDRETLAVDFDGVIHSYVSGWQGSDVIPDPPIPGAFEFLAEATKHFEVMVLSARAENNEAVIAMNDWFTAHGLPDTVLEQIFITSVKPKAALYIDDRGYCFKGTFPSIDMIKNFKPWKVSDGPTE